jgi:hypothetical protein
MERAGLCNITRVEPSISKQLRSREKEISRNVRDI